jgi:hypothetical protein
MIKKCVIGISLAIMLVAFGFVHEACADGATLSGSGVSSSAASGGPAGGGVGGGSGGNPCPPNNPHCGAVAVPEPPTVILLAAGLVALACLVALRKRMRVN